MKWLKKYSIFLEQDETSDDITSTEETSLNDIECVINCERALNYFFQYLNELIE